MRTPGTTVSQAVRDQTMINNPWRKPVITPHGQFPSVKAAARQLGLSVEVVNYRLRAGEQQRAAVASGQPRPGYIDFTGWIKTCPQGRDRGYSRPIETPAGRFDSIAAAARHYGITSSAIITRIRSWGDQYRYCD